MKSHTLSSDHCWQQVLNRQESAEVCFVYAVHTTGIYCRPSCPSRRPARHNVEFFPSSACAERAGFRACLRCRPKERLRALDLVERATAAIAIRLERGEPADSETLAGELGLSASHLVRTFKRRLGVSPREYTEALRAERFKSGLRSGKNVTEALYDAGYGSSSRIYEQRSCLLGMPPRAYKRGGAGQQIRFATFKTCLGAAIIAATEHGVCAIKLGESKASLETELRAELPQAVLTRDDGGMREWCEQIIQFAAGKVIRLELPLAVQATVFQQKVWAQLHAIPYGTTRTYRQIAETIGSPKAARAVARACAANPAALVTPCHRVVRGDGEIAGYRWGAERKKLLLALESKKR